MHILVIFGFMNFLPYSKHFMFLLQFQMFILKNLGKKKFEIKSINLEDETIEQFGAADVEHLNMEANV